ncbi:DUF2231 domain-containing protein [Guptibacillus spartinae]|uniref:DUF2231 domain-containing protein n=1 Tax=Guptibacillus spartinae TaxID=3025679 RepID=UPI00235E134D|nr:DUF2231 domain-containing protein [Pseudalkalibacillus spartinae]
MLSSPLHPLLVHFPIALLFIGVVAQFLTFWKEDYFEKIALFLLPTGFVFAVISYVTGDSAEGYAFDHWGRQVEYLIHTHETYALITLVVFGAITALKLLNLIIPLKWIKPLVLILCLSGIITLSLTGHYGGKIVYDHETMSSLSETK